MSLKLWILSPLGEPIYKDNGLGVSGGKSLRANTRVLKPLAALVRPALTYRIFTQSQHFNFPQHYRLAIDIHEGLPILAGVPFLIQQYRSSGTDYPR